MRIAIVTERFPPNIFGGGEISSYLLAKALAEDKEVHVITKGSNKVEIIDNFTVHRIIPDGSPRIPEILRRSEYLYLTSFLSILRTLKGMDIVHVHSMKMIPGTLFACKIKGIPVVATVNDAWATCYYSLHFRNGKLCEHCSTQGLMACLDEHDGNTLGVPYIKASMQLKYASISRCDGLMPHSLFIKEILEKNGIGVEKRFIPPIVDTESFCYEDVRGTGKVLYAGRVDLGKGVEDAILSIERAGIGNLVIAGTGKELEKCKKLSRSLGITDRVEFKGKVPYEEIPKLIHESDIVIAPFRRIEPIGRIVLEANACGRGVITTSVCGANSVLIRDGHNGFIVEPGDVERMGELICSVLSDRTLASTLGRNGRKIIEERFSPGYVKDEVLKFYRHVIGKAHAGRSA